MTETVQVKFIFEPPAPGGLLIKIIKALFACSLNKLIEEDRRIQYNLPLLWEDGKWELNRQQMDYVEEEV